ncbi:hypothetical protein CDL12_04658 [Handroanthus impetiginosus]|uniref:DUF1771 domain-containing protein n=1 Tax=Handroanthus impetiginosus TaxID=429701 RepID=A0A2G9HZ43_9LAMI|nr:hypothetical protein CDL12_04658 [Handroanthus impetiginosus]
MKVEAPPSNFLYTDDDHENLKQLLDTFGSVVSLEDIASAYCETGRNLNSTAEMLCNQQSKSADEGNSTILSSGCGSSNTSENAPMAKLKPKRCSAAMGTVSNVIGKDYIKPRPQSNGRNEKLKPLKLNADDCQFSEISDENEDILHDLYLFPFLYLTHSHIHYKYEMGCLSIYTSFPLFHSSLHFFLKCFKICNYILSGYSSQCGYNMARSIDKLLDLSAATLEKSDDVIGIADGNTMKNSLDLEPMSCREQSPVTDFSRRSNADVNSGNGFLLPQTVTKKNDTQREVLEALFSGPNRIEEKQESSAPSRPCRQTPYGQVVAKPMEETIIEDFTFITRLTVNRNDEANQNSYEDLRKAVREYWAAMKEYYKAALDAFTRKDFENARRLQEEGNFFMRKAQEADEKSAQKLIDSDEEEEFSLNMLYFEPKDAVNHMKLQLKALSGLPSICYLKVVVGTNSGDNKDGRRKRLITKLLEREGITWTEEGDGWTISIRVDEIDPKTLSFANK